MRSLPFYMANMALSTEAFIERVKSTANNLGVAENILATLLERISQRQTAEAELDILKSVYVQKIGTPFPAIPVDKWAGMVEIHAKFQLRRTAEFNRLAQNQAVPRYSHGPGRSAKTRLEQILRRS